MVLHPPLSVVSLEVLQLVLGFLQSDGAIGYSSRWLKIALAQVVLSNSLAEFFVGLSVPPARISSPSWYKAAGSSEKNGGSDTGLFARIHHNFSRKVHCLLTQGALTNANIKKD